MAEIDYRELNLLAQNPMEAIKTAEDEYHARVNEIAKTVRNSERIRLVLLAGPSGSGKTTTANLIKDAIIRRGGRAMVVSLDDFYKDENDPTYPLTKDGKRDYECPEALRLDEVSETLANITEGRTFFLPKYDFKRSARVSMKKYGANENTVVIIEGLHALNPKISSRLLRDSVLKIFVSVSTNINDAKERILSGRKLRFVRRMVRDSIYRATDAGRTLEMWGGVLSAEDEYLYPYKMTADIAFDTFHKFEPSVMAGFAKRLIDTELEEKNAYARTVITALRLITEIDPHSVPENSLIKEFIPGGIYEELY